MNLVSTSFVTKYDIHLMKGVENTFHTQIDELPNEIVMQ